MRVHAIVEDLETARRAVEAGATVVQLRVKAPTAEVVARGAGFGGLGTTFVVNDDVDAALELGADGVHLGQDDAGRASARARPASCSAARRRRSTRRVAADADYLGVGPDLGDAVEGGRRRRRSASTELARDLRRRRACRWSRSAASTRRTRPTCIRAGAAGVAVIRAATDPDAAEGGG